MPQHLKTYMAWLTAIFVLKQKHTFRFWYCYTFHASFFVSKTNYSDHNNAFVYIICELKLHPMTDFEWIVSRQAQLIVVLITGCTWISFGW